MEFVGLFGAILGVAGTVGGAAGVFFANRSRSVITLYKDENDALAKANNRLEKDLEVQLAKCSAAQREAQIWRDNVTQAPSIKELTKVMTDQNQQVIQSLGNVATELSSLTKALTKAQKMEKK